MKTRPEQVMGFIISILGALAVILGAFGAHGLEDYLSADQKETYQTAVIYHLVHVLAGLFSTQRVSKDQRWARLSVVFFILGILLFSGSLYLLSTAQLTSIPASWVGPITPIGGVFFILGWVSLGADFLRG